MLQKSTYEFLKQLNKNNNREWFAENKTKYDAARADFENLVAQVIPGIAEFDPGIGNPEPKKCVFRIYRDTRFSTDKTPYKPNFGAIIRQGERGSDLSGYYIHVAPDIVFISCGFYMLPPDLLKRVRQFIYDDFSNFKAIIDDKKFKQEFGDLQEDEDMLKRVPAGFDKNHPAAEYMKLKHFYVMKQLSEKDLYDKDFVNNTVKAFKLMYPFNKYLNNILEN
jgi:uncharacterized protein (TIGR02453 family)